ncbi:hypothetical protein ENBRE01_0816 [Enteropsectra breve]|nr:hypothetical protein ENBRE01_0816 [Enteropsectra breve]
MKIFISQALKFIVVTILNSIGIGFWFMPRLVERVGLMVPLIVMLVSASTSAFIAYKLLAIQDRQILKKRQYRNLQGLKKSLDDKMEFTEWLKLGWGKIKAFYSKFSRKSIAEYLNSMADEMAVPEENEAEEYELEELTGIKCHSSENKDTSVVAPNDKSAKEENDATESEVKALLKQRLTKADYKKKIEDAIIVLSDELDRQNPSKSRTKKALMGLVRIAFISFQIYMSGVLINLYLKMACLTLDAGKFIKISDGFVVQLFVNKVYASAYWFVCSFLVSFFFFTTFFMKFFKYLYGLITIPALYVWFGTILGTPAWKTNEGLVGVHLWPAIQTFDFPSIAMLFAICGAAIAQPTMINSAFRRNERTIPLLGALATFCGSLVSIFINLSYGCIGTFFMGGENLLEDIKQIFMGSGTLTSEREQTSFAISMILMTLVYLTHTMFLVQSIEIGMGKLLSFFDTRYSRKAIRVFLSVYVIQNAIFFRKAHYDTIPSINEAIVLYNALYFIMPCIYIIFNQRDRFMRHKIWIKANAVFFGIIAFAVAFTYAIIKKSYYEDRGAFYFTSQNFALLNDSGPNWINDLLQKYAGNFAINKVSYFEAETNRIVNMVENYVFRSRS